LEKLASIDINNLTPIEAINLKSNKKMKLMKSKFDIYIGVQFYSDYH